MSLFDGLMNVVTLGGHSRLKDAKEKYQDAYTQYKTVHDEITTLHGKMSYEVELLGDTTKDSFKLIYKASWLLRAVRPKITDISHGQSLSVTLDNSTPKTAAALSQYSSVLSVTTGVGAGSAVAIGSWALVSLVGTASTGTAIVGLAGGAATNATLAWFGGGALAAGGAGMAGGAMVLGGLFAAPLIIYSVWSSHSQAKEIELKTKDIDLASEELKPKIIELYDVFQVVKTQHNRLKKAYETFEAEYKIAKGLLLPYGFISIIYYYIRLLFGWVLYSEEDKITLLNLTDALESFSEQFVARTTLNNEPP